MYEMTTVGVNRKKLEGEPHYYVESRSIELSGMQKSLKTLLDHLVEEYKSTVNPIPFSTLLLITTQKGDPGLENAGVDALST